MAMRSLMLIVPAATGIIVLMTPCLAADSTLLGVSKNWTAVTTGTADDKVCFAISKPVSSSPRKLKRDPTGFLINDWPTRKAKAQPEIVPGYKYKNGSEVSVQVGGENFLFFANNDGDSGNAWMKRASDEARLVEAMQKNARLVVSGTTSRGTKTYDTYSLEGLGDALTKAHTACNMQ